MTDDSAKRPSEISVELQAWLTGAQGQELCQLLFESLGPDGCCFKPGDPYQTAFLAGRREAVLRIFELANFKPGRKGQSNE